jgi:Mg-chelatase subunit ChlD
MNKPHSEIVFILDRSGSMQSMVEAAISGFNRLLREQQQVPGSARFTLVLFDDQYESPIHSVPIAEVVELDTSTFVPRGSTALLDAIGQTIDELGDKLASTPEAERPSQVIIAILTDGQENASTRYTWECVAKRIRHQTKKYQWQFLFLGANQDAIATAGRMNIQEANTANFAMTERSYDSSKGALSRKMSAFRRRSQGDTDSSTVHDAEAPLETLREEEERKSDT